MGILRLIVWLQVITVLWQMASSCSKKTTTDDKRDMSRRTYIVGGQEAPKHSIPYQVGLTMFYSVQTMCGGALISENFVLTAAHCVAMRSPSDIRVVVGEHDFKIKNDGQVYHNVSDIIIHPDYNVTSINQDCDLAILKLEDPVELNDKVNTVQLPDDEFVDYIGQKLVVSGWGDHTQFSYLKMAQLDGISNEECRKDYPDITDNHLCMKDSNEVNAPCVGDSGGPLTMAISGVPILLGIVSWGKKKCSPSDVSVFSSVATQLTWIIESTDIPRVKVNSYTKIAIALGESPNSYLNDIEVIDLTSAKTRCQNLPDFPQRNYQAAGGLGFDNHPIICGGHDHNRSSCYSLINGSWKEDASLKEERFAFAMTRSPIPNDGSILFAAGGKHSTTLNSSEVLTRNGWQLTSPMPEQRYRFCMVQIKPTMVMVISGSTDQYYDTSAKTFIFDGETKLWSEGPQLWTPRWAHYCAMIRKDRTTKNKSIIVVGGRTLFSRLSSTEVFDLGSTTSRWGPDLPYGISSAAMVEDPSGGVILIGGIDPSDEYVDSLFKLENAGYYTKWEKMSQKLKTPRVLHTAFLIPDEIANCTKIDREN